MMRFLLSFLTFLNLNAMAQAGIDETYVRPSSQGWGQEIAAKVGIPGFGRSVAIVIGVGSYDNGWSPLESPPRDAERMRDFLRDEANFDIIYTITNEKASRDKIRQLMVNELPKIIGSQDRVIFYFSGHGAERELYNSVEGYLVLSNSGSDDYASMIEMGDIRRWWKGIGQAKQSLFILDACFSGLGLQSMSSLRDRTINELSRRGHHLVTAGSANQESYASLSRWGGSLFTTALLDGMKGSADSSTQDAPADGIVSLKELWDYVDKRVRSETPPNAMTPQLGTFEFSNAGEFFFIYDSDAVRTVGLQEGLIKSKGRENDILLQSLATDEESSSIDDLFEKSVATTISNNSKLTEYIAFNSNDYSPGDTGIIKIKSFSSEVSAYALIDFESTGKLRVRAQYDPRHGGIYIPFKIPETESLGLKEVVVYLQALNSSQQDVHTLQIKISE